VETPLQEFQSTKNVTFTCLKSNHSNTLSAGSFINKKSKHTRENKNLEEFCQGCIDSKDDQETFEQHKKSILESCGHLLVEYEFSTRNLVYICGECGERNNSHISNLQKNKGNCPKCQNVQFRLSYDKLKKDVESHGFQLLTKAEDYKSNKQKLNVICKCGEKHETYLVSIRQDKHCKKCKTEKSEQTCLEKYNERNVMHIPEVFERSKKNQWTNKQYTFPKSQKTITVQGSEPVMIDYILSNENKILKRIIDENEIDVSNVPGFKYIFENKEHVYYPDVFIKETKIVYECKMIALHNRQGPTLNYKKYKSASEQGFTVIVFMVNNDYKLFDIWYFLPNGKEISTLRQFNNVEIDFRQNISSKLFVENFDKIEQTVKIDF
jgi:hypothetical protein